MKKAIYSTITLVLLTFLSSIALAQPPAGGPGGPMGGRAMMNPEQRAERQAAMMQDSLLLSDELTADVQEVLLVYAKKMQTARTESDGDWQTMRGTMQTLRKEQNEELAAILGEEKWARWEKITAQFAQRRGEGQEGRRPGRRKSGGK